MDIRNEIKSYIVREGLTMAEYNGPPVKTKKEGFIVNQGFPNSYDLYSPLSRKMEDTELGSRPRSGLP